MIIKLGTQKSQSISKHSSFSLQEPVLIKKKKKKNMSCFVINIILDILRLEFESEYYFAYKCRQ